MQLKAQKRVDDEKPELLVVCPMCGPFSTWQAINYQSMSEAEVRDKLTGALKHLKYALELCHRQWKAGRMFIFEHLVAATSWGTKMMAAMARLEGVHMVNFDFCGLGMTTEGESGDQVPARKRTRVLTNSCHIVAALK
jgi:hypothetical protein